MRKFAFIVISVLVICLNVRAQSDWKGSYFFDENGGKTAGGTPILISHVLEVMDGGEGLIASLESNGYQTSTNLICTAKVNGSKLMVHFQSYGEDNMFEPYQPGDLLFTLERKTEKGKNVILTYWGKFTPAVTKNQKTGKVYFEKASGK